MHRRSERVQLQVWAGRASLELGLLHTLACRRCDPVFDARFDQPLRLSVQGLETDRRGGLGQSGAGGVQSS